MSYGDEPPNQQKCLYLTKNPHLENLAVKILFCELKTERAANRGNEIDSRYTAYRLLE